MDFLTEKHYMKSIFLSDFHRESLGFSTLELMKNYIV